MSVYPNPVKATQHFIVNVSGFNEKELETADLKIYDLQGVQLYYSNSISKSNSISLPAIPGAYVGHVTIANGNQYTFKIIMKK